MRFAPQILNSVKKFNVIEEHFLLMSDDEVVVISCEEPIHLEPPRPVPAMGKRTKLLTVLWTPEEDAKLKELVEGLGTKDWHKIGKSFLRHSSRQCKERWDAIKPKGKYFLKPALFTREEDVLMWRKVQELGKKWDLVVRFFPGRTEAQVQTRYQVLRKKVRNYVKKATTNKYLVDEITDIITKRAEEPPLPRFNNSLK